MTPLPRITSVGSPPERGAPGPGQGPVHLMYHSVHDPRSPRPAGPFHRNKYTVEKEALAEHVRIARGNPVVFTFDDGHVSVHEHARELLSGHVEAIVFVSTDFIGAEGWLSSKHIEELHRGGVKIGAHGCSHVNLTRVSDERLGEELRRSKFQLEEILSAPVTDMAMVGGHYDRRVLRAARRAGYETLFGSAPRRGRGSDGVLGRIPVLSTTSPRELRLVCAGRLPWRRVVSYWAKQPVKELLNRSAVLMSKGEHP